MRILGIETSCDETAAAIVEDGRIVRSNVIASSRKTFELSGGVIPEQAAREQVRCMLPVIEQSLEGVIADPAELDAIAVTRGPGLLGSLLIGTTAARTLAHLWQRPLIGVHHTLGHLSSTWLRKEQDPADEPAFPLLTLSVSGGHTDVWLRESHTKGRLLGKTIDDAAGEAFDKGAMLLGLPYPGGPAIARTAAEGKQDAFEFPSPLKNEQSLNFSFSGLKTALRYVIRDLGEGWEARRGDLAASYEHAICRHLYDRVVRAIAEHPEIREVHIVGGVSANQHLRTALTSACPNHIVRFPLHLEYCTDNAAMIAAAGTFLWQEKGETALMPFDANASLNLTEALHQQ